MSIFARIGLDKFPLLHLSPRLARLAVLSLVAMFCTGFMLIFQTGFQSLEERIGALGWTLAPDSDVEERITLVVIDEDSLAEVGPWPWARKDIARLITAIDEAGAQLQLHDIVYPEARPGDIEVLEAIAKSNATVFAQVPVMENHQPSSSSGIMTHPLSGVSCAGLQGATRIPVADSFIGSASALGAVPKGHIGAIIESDGSVRKSPALVCNAGQIYPSLPLVAFLQLAGPEIWEGQLEKGASLLGPPAVLSLAAYPGLDIPLDQDGAMRISFAKSPASFRALSAADVMAGRVDTAMLDNAWVLVGGTAFSMGDIVPTPYSGAVPGVELQARLLASLLDVDIPYTPAGSTWLMILICTLFAAVCYWLAGVGDRVAAYGLPIAGVVLPLLAAGLHISMLAIANIWLGWLAPALFGLFAASAMLLLELASVRMDKARVFGNLNSYLPVDVAREIAFSVPNSRIHAHRREVTLLSADLRNFSAFGEARPPEEIAAVLHFFFTRATEIIEKHGGSVHEFKGDSLLAMWDSADRGSASKSFNAAHDMQRALNDTLLPARALTGLEPLALGIGIEQGPVLVGSIGPAHRRSHTLLGDTVGISLRIQEMTAELAQPILIGECAARQLVDQRLESQGSYLLNGLRIPHILFAPADMDNIADISAVAPKLTMVSGGKR
ncbi:MAG: hypothetical protein CMD33_00540 [Flavobacteriales bacterium]|nr:hypothetical protein [Flavobacteriales bacterium]